MNYSATHQLILEGATVGAWVFWNWKAFIRPLSWDVSCPELALTSMAAAAIGNR